MKHLWSLALLAVAFVGADNKPADKPADKKTDKDRIQGAWVVTGVEAKGEAVKSGELFDRVNDLKLTFKDDGTVINSKHPDDKWTYKLDPDKNPPTLDIVVKTPQGADTMRALYRFKDDNTLQICGAKDEKERPKEFGSKDDQIVLTLTREKK